MQHLEPGQDFVMTIVKLLVDYPDAVSTETVIDKMGVLIVLKVDDRDLGKVIGKHGVTINAIRSLLRVLGAKQDARYSLKVDDGNESMDSSNRHERVSQPQQVEEVVQERDNIVDLEDSIVEDNPVADLSSTTRSEIEDLDDLDL